MSSSNFCVLKEFSITTTITVSIIMFIGVVFQFKVTDMLMTKKTIQSELIAKVQVTA